jgi:hypothetical protein
METKNIDVLRLVVEEYHGVECIHEFIMGCLNTYDNMLSMDIKNSWNQLLKIDT